ncbi:MAG TPA: XRE family transcriptional regulator [Myxococcota bacterium]|nr:XRE family transcriptional regulator [Myxococcota bacterium]
MASVPTVHDPGENLASNVRRLRESRGLSQQQMARLAGMPRPTWASLESGSANPTLQVLKRAAAALQVSIEELIGPPRTACRRFAAADVPERRRQGARLRPLLPESIAGLEIARMELAPGGQLSGIPHTPGTREYLFCEGGRLELHASGERWELGPGEVLVFRGDQRHGYRNPDARRPSLAISVVCFAPVASAT